MEKNIIAKRKYNFLFLQIFFQKVHDLKRKTMNTQKSELIYWNIKLIQINFNE